MGRGRRLRRVGVRSLVEEVGEIWSFKDWEELGITAAEAMRV
jgi:hypothetical protein